MRLDEHNRCFTHVLASKYALGHYWAPLLIHRVTGPGKAEARLHIVQGLLTAQQNIDAVVKTIRAADSAADARAALEKAFALSSPILFFSEIRILKHCLAQCCLGDASRVEGSEWTSRLLKLCSTPPRRAVVI